MNFRGAQGNATGGDRHDQQQSAHDAILRRAAVKAAISPSRS
jgi:hypothetical protein